MKKLIETIFPYIAIAFVVLSILSRMLFGADNSFFESIDAVSREVAFQEGIKCRVLCHWP